MLALRSPQEWSDWTLSDKSLSRYLYLIICFGERTQVLHAVHQALNNNDLRFILKVKNEKIISSQVTQIGFMKVQRGIYWSQHKQSDLWHWEISREMCLVVITGFNRFHPRELYLQLFRVSKSFCTTYYYFEVSKHTSILAKEHPFRVMSYYLLSSFTLWKGKC